MEHNSGNEITASEMKALLAELQDICGEGETTPLGPSKQSKDNGARLTAQQPPAPQTHRLLANVPRPMNDQLLSKSGGNSLGQVMAERRSTSTPTVSKTPGFSTYVISPSNSSGLGDKSKRHTPIPLGVRLAPIDSSGANSKPNTHLKERLSRSSLKSPALLSASTPSALPPLSGGDAFTLSSITTQSPLPDLKNSSLKLDKDQTCATEADGLPQGAQHPVSGNATQPPLTHCPAGDCTFEVNFLPIMCALNLAQTGLRPTPRWGHTLTAVGEDQLLLFGGMETSAMECGTMMVFDTTTNEWGPAYVVPNDGLVKGGASSSSPPPPLPSARLPPPATRHSHAACAYEGHCLIIYGGVSTHGHLIYNDIHMYDTLTHSWKCLWNGPPSEAFKNQSDSNSIGSKKLKKNESAARFGHSMVVRDDRLYIFGGKVVGQEGVATTNSADVYVFSLSLCCWKKRIRPNGVNTDASVDVKTPEKHCITEPKVASGAGSVKDLAETKKSNSDGCAPCARAYHAATVKGDVMYLNGGAGEDGEILSDTWQLNLKTGVWSCLHHGNDGGAIPRERHKMFACGEAIMVIGGCSPSPHSSSVAMKFAHFVAVLPLLGQSTPFWIPVAMGNASIIAPGKKNFAAAFCGGFMYVFGGSCGSEPGSNNMVRFLAANGYACEDGKDIVVDSDESLRRMMQSLQNKASFTVPYDVLAAADIAGGDTEERGGEPAREALGCPDSRYHVGFHRVILQQRAPKFLESLLACRSESAVATQGKGSMDYSKLSQMQLPPPREGGPTGNNTYNGGGSEDGDVVDALLLQKNAPYREAPHSVSASGCSTFGMSNDSVLGSTAPIVSNGMVYYVQGNTRVKGLPHPLTAEELRCLANYIYWGGLKAKFRLLLKDDDDDDTVQTKGASAEVTERQRLRTILLSLCTAADDYNLKPLRDLAEALLEGDRNRLYEARQQSATVLRNDMLQLLDASKGATVTVLFVDPHTKQRKAHALHPVVLTSSSSFFKQLLRPLFKEGKTSVSMGSVVAKLSASDTSILRKSQYQEGRGASAGPVDVQSASKAPSLVASKTSIVVGTVSVPFPAIQILLRYLYTKQLDVPQQLALETMMGAHQLGLSLLKAHCEAIVGRSDVNYDSCCSFYFLSKRYKASLLQELSLLTAVSGYSKVRSEAAFRDLPEEDRNIIDAVSMELGSDTWVPPQQPTQEMKPSTEYASRWNAISH